MSRISVFVSHSADDRTLAEAVVDLIQGVTDIGDNAIRCTSVSGYRLDLGDDAGTVLLRNLREADVVIGLITSRSMASEWVLFELGAAWALGTRVVPLLGPSVPYSVLPGPMKSFHAARMEDTSDLASMIDLVAQTAKARRAGLPRVMRALDTFSGSIQTAESTEGD